MTLKPENHVISIGYPKIIPYIKFEHFGILGLFVFELCSGH